MAGDYVPGQGYVSSKKPPADGTAPAIPSTTIPVAPTLTDRAISFGRSFMTPSPAAAANTAPTTTGNPLEALIGKTQDRKLVEMKKLGI